MNQTELAGKGATHILSIRIKPTTQYYADEYLIESLIEFIERKTLWKHYKDLVFYINSLYSHEFLDIALFSVMREFALKEYKILKTGSKLLDVDISYTIIQRQETNYRNFKLSDFIILGSTI
jgi:hypothetical protein